MRQPGDGDDALVADFRARQIGRQVEACRPAEEFLQVGANGGAEIVRRHAHAQPLQQLEAERQRLALPAAVGQAVDLYAGRFAHPDRVVAMRPDRREHEVGLLQPSQLVEPGVALLLHRQARRRLVRHAGQVEQAEGRLEVALGRRVSRAQAGVAGRGAQQADGAGAFGGLAQVLPHRQVLPGRFPGPRRQRRQPARQRHPQRALARRVQGLVHGLLHAVVAETQRRARPGALRLALFQP